MSRNIHDYNFLKKLESLKFIDEIWLFGSRARGDNQDRADIDLAIICPDASDSDWHEIIEIIENADTLLKIDCIRFDKDRMNNQLYENIMKDKRVMYMKELPWKDHFYTLGKAINRLNEVINHPEFGFNDFLRDAAIQRFEFTIELFWKILKKILLHEKIEVSTPRDTLSQAFSNKLINSEEEWLKMLDDRNNTSHTYKEEEAKRIIARIKIYLPIYEETYAALQQKYKL